MLAFDELSLFKRELDRLEKEKRNQHLPGKYKQFLDEQIHLLQDVINSYKK